MPTVKEYNIKLSRLKNTRKMTKTMKMVAANKLRKAQDAQKNISGFSVQLDHALDNVLHCAGIDEVHPLLKARTTPRKILVLVITSDRGLCGGFNSNLNRKVMRWVTEKTEEDRDIRLTCCGRRGYSYLRTRANVINNYEGVIGKPTFADACRIGADLQKAFLSGECDEVYLAYNVFKSVLSQTPSVEPLLPLSIPAAGASSGGSVDLMFEPGAPEVVDQLLPKIVNVRIFGALLSSLAGEHGSRMTAMENATNNADSLIESYTLLRNRARQAAITKELIEIVSGAEALRAVS